MERLLQVAASVTAAALPASGASAGSRLASLTSPLPPGGECSSSRSFSAEPLFDTAALQLWILVACQDLKGLRDKPGTRADFYHTCYCLSGLSTAQQYGGCVIGHAGENVVRRTEAALNVLPERFAQAAAFFDD